MLDLFFNNNQAPALNADNMNRIVDEINRTDAKTKDLQSEIATLVIEKGGSIVQANPEESATESEELNSLRINDKVYNIATASLNARITELDEKLDTEVSQLEDSIDVKVTQLTFETGIDIGDWEAVMDPDEPVIYERYMNYHDAVAKLSQQIDIMGNRTDDLKTSLNELDNIVFNIANNGYNANTDRNVLENRINAIKYVINNIMKNRNGFCGTVIRYSGGYYFHYYITRVQNSEISALEIDVYSKKIRMIQINNTSGEGTVLKEI